MVPGHNPRPGTKSTEIWFLTGSQGLYGENVVSR